MMMVVTDNTRSKALVLQVTWIRLKKYQAFLSYTFNVIIRTTVFVDIQNLILVGNILCSRYS